VSEKKPIELRVSVDVGYRRHSVAIGLPSGEVLEEFEIAHRPEGFEQFFSRIEKHHKKEPGSVAAREIAKESVSSPHLPACTVEDLLRP
jgi:hypothetical protein